MDPLRDMANHKKDEEEFLALHPDHPCASEWDEGEVCRVLFKASDLIRYLPGPTLGKHVEANVCTSQSGGLEKIHCSYTSHIYSKSHSTLVNFPTR